MAADQDQEGKVYCRAALVEEETGYSVYSEVANLIIYWSCNLSVFRFKSDDVPLVAVFGDAPSDELDEQIKRILESKGVPIALPAKILRLLEDSRHEESIPGIVVQRKYRPVRRLRP